MDVPCFSSHVTDSDVRILCLKLNLTSKSYGHHLNDQQLLQHFYPFLVQQVQHENISGYQETLGVKIQGMDPEASRLVLGWHLSEKVRLLTNCRNWPLKPRSESAHFRILSKWNLAFWPKTMDNSFAEAGIWNKRHENWPSKNGGRHFGEVWTSIRTGRKPSWAILCTTLRRERQWPQVTGYNTCD